MNLNEYAAFDGLGLAELVKKREISPGELARTAKLAIDTADPIIHAVIETYADRIAVNIYQLTEVRPLNRQKYRTDPLFHVFNTNLTGVTLDMQVNYNEIVNFNKPEDEV